MNPQSSGEQFATIYENAARLCKAVEADALLVVLDAAADWDQLRSVAKGVRVVVAGNEAEHLEGAEEAGLSPVVLDVTDAPVFERLTQALLQSVADEILTPGAAVVAVYPGFQPGLVDSISFISLDKNLGRLTARDLRQIETSVPLDTLKIVVDLAIDIGREGREGKPVGTLFVVGDTRKVLEQCRPMGFDPVRGYSRKERSLHDSRSREWIKEISQLDGAIIVAPDGTVEKSCQLVNADHAHLTLSKGLGSRHWAGAAISRNTKAIAVVVSESNGTVRLFNNGEVILRVEPFRRAMKWKDFASEPPASGD